MSLQNPEGLQRLTLHQGCTMVEEKRLWASTHLQVGGLNCDMAPLSEVSLQPSFWCCSISLQRLDLIKVKLVVQRTVGKTFEGCA